MPTTDPQRLVRQAAYRQANRETLAAKWAAYAAEHADRIESKNAAYREANREVLARKWRQYYDANREQILARRRARRTKGAAQ